MIDRIWIVQCLCPDRHCIMALAFDPADLAEAEAVARLKALVHAALNDSTINPWCALCGPTRGPSSWFYEAAPTRFRTMEEAEPALRQAEADQLRTRAYVQDLVRRLADRRNPR